jgi:hypothetical protein
MMLERLPAVQPATGPHPSISWSVLAASEERVEEAEWRWW